jgi:ABC-type sulfate transport system permease component
MACERSRLSAEILVTAQIKSWSRLLGRYGSMLTVAMMSSFSRARGSEMIR